jgi:hypothetical protein
MKIMKTNTPLPYSKYFDNKVFESFTNKLETFKEGPLAEGMQKLKDATEEFYLRITNPEKASVNSTLTPEMALGDLYAQVVEFHKSLTKEELRIPLFLQAVVDIQRAVSNFYEEHGNNQN